MHRTSYGAALVGLIAIAMLLSAGCTSTPAGNATITPIGTEIPTPVPMETPGTSLTPGMNETPMTPLPNQTNTSANATPVFMNTTWEWTAIEAMDGTNLTVVNNSTLYTLRFAPDGAYGIKADCNVGGGNYTLDGSALNLSDSFTTLAWCGNESQDSLYLASLQNVSAYTLAQDGRLLLSLGETDERMVFVANITECRSSVDAPYVGPTWHWTGLTQTMPSKVVQVSNPKLYTLEFADNGSYMIRADCNQGHGTFTLESKTLAISTPALTRVYCGDNSLDRVFLDGLSRVKSFQMDANGGLVLTMENPNNRMTFKP